MSSSPPLAAVVALCASLGCSQTPLVASESAPDPDPRPNGRAQRAAATPPPSSSSEPPLPELRSLMVPAAGPKKYVKAIRNNLSAVCEEARPRTVVAGPWRRGDEQWIAGMCLPAQDVVTEDENDGPLYVELGVFRVDGAELERDGGGRTSGGGGVLDYSIPRLQNEALLRAHEPPCPVTIIKNTVPGDRHRAVQVFCRDGIAPLVIRLPAELDPDCAPVRGSTDPATPVVAEFDCARGGSGALLRAWKLSEDGFVKRGG